MFGFKSASDFFGPFLFDLSGSLVRFVVLTLLEYNPSTHFRSIQPPKAKSKTACPCSCYLSAGERFE